MATWKLASAVFAGGTQEIRKLVGTRVRTRTNLHALPLFDPIHHRMQDTDLAIHRQGFVANPHDDCLLIAFPAEASSTEPSLDALKRSGRFKVVIVNEPTFKQQFEVEQT